MAQHNRRVQRPVRVIADDLSGANTTAALFHNLGWPVVIHVSMDGWPVPTALEGGRRDVIQVWNAGTRNLQAETANQLFRRMAPALEGTVAFRIDSTLRGPIVASLDAWLDELEGAVAFVVPAYPDSGRTTVNGVQFVGGTPVHETSVGQDPLCPVQDSDIRRAVGEKSRHAFAHLSLETLRRLDRVSWLRGCVEQGVRIFLCDALSNRDIVALAAAAVSLEASGVQVIPVDPGPFTAAFTTASEARSSDFVPSILGISASVMHNAREQMDYLEQVLGVPMVHYCGQPVHEVMDAWKAAVAQAAISGSTLLNPSGLTLFLRTDTWVLEPTAALSAIVELPRIVAQAVNCFPSLKGFYFSGGEAAATILKGLDVSSLSMEMEIAPLTTMTRALDGHLAGRLIVTKGGAIGHQRAVAEALTKLHEMIVRQEV